MRNPRIWLLALAFALAIPGLARGDYVRDELRINMRTGPGTQYRILKALASGDKVSRLDSSGDWIQVRTPEGLEGWVPGGYLSPEPPASLALPTSPRHLRL